MTKQELYESKFVTLDDALNMIRSGDTISTAYYGNEPREFLRSLHQVAERGVEDLTVWVSNPQEAYPFICMDELRGTIDIRCVFYGKPLREHHASERISYAPNHLHACWHTIWETQRPNVFVAAVTPIDEYGYVCLSLSQQSELEMLDRCDLVICEVNPKLPRTMGTVRIPVAQVDYFYHADYEVVHSPLYPSTPAQQRIADYAASLIKDGDCIQLGIGGLPDAVAERLRDRHDLGIHTEMIGSAIGRLMECGAVNNSRKNYYRNRTVGAFVWGSQALYDYLDDNPLVEILPVNQVNDPFNIMKNRNMVSVNTALEVDLTGQICSETVNGMQYSGTGGAEDFAYGAFHAENGRGIIALNATAKNGTISRIKAQLTPGSVVSISRNVVDMVVTEYGVAKLRGKCIRDRVSELIRVAHPDFREELRSEARRLQIW